MVIKPVLPYLHCSRVVSSNSTFGKSLRRGVGILFYLEFHSLFITCIIRCVVMVNRLFSCNEFDPHWLFHIFSHVLHVIYRPSFPVCRRELSYDVLLKSKNCWYFFINVLWPFRAWAIVALHYFPTFVSFTNLLFLSSFLIPVLSSIYIILLGRAPIVSSNPSCLQPLVGIAFSSPPFLIICPVVILMFTPLIDEHIRSSKWRHWKCSLNVCKRYVLK